MTWTGFSGNTIKNRPILSSIESFIQQSSSPSSAKSTKSLLGTMALRTRLHHPLSSAALLAKNYDIKYRMGDELNEQ